MQPFHIALAAVLVVAFSATHSLKSQKIAPCPGVDAKGRPLDENGKPKPRPTEKPVHQPGDDEIDSDIKVFADVVEAAHLKFEE